MKIETVKISKFKCLEDFNAEIKGKNILLVADNGKGKSSFMQFIRIAMGDNTCIPPNAEGSGVVIMDKNGKELTFTVKMKEGKASIRIKGEDVYIDDKKGAIAGLIGAVDFNINEFVEWSKTKTGQKKQVEKFKEFLPQDLRLELGKLENKVKMAYDERTEINKEKDKLNKLIQAHPLVNTDPIDLRLMTEIDIKEKSKELSIGKDKNLIRTNTINDGVKRANLIKDEEKEITELEKEIKRIGDKIDVRKKKIEEYTKENNTAKEWLNNPKNSLVEVAVLEKEIEDAGETNKKYTKAQELLKLQKELEEQINLSGELTVKIESSRQSISDAIKDMSNPVEGLTFNDEMLLYNDIPVSIDSLSHSELIELGVKLKMAENPELGILFIEQGESIGKERMKLIIDIATKNNFQVIMEQVVRGKEKLEIEIIGE
jgi:hypothetical protein